MAGKRGAALASRSKQAAGLASNRNDTDGSCNSSGDTIIDEDSSMTNGSAQDTPGTNSPNSAAGFNIDQSSSNALASLSRESNKLLSVINELALLGLEKYSLELPKIVTIGDQSAGKSSAIAAISGITVPRKAGICTKCPSHISLKHSDNGEWSCTVSLEKRYMFDQGTWQLSPESHVIELARITSPEQLEDVLKLAQRASLNPSKDPMKFITSNSDLPMRDQVGLSPNLVQLDIAGPHCPNLTFYDLPGVFNQTADKSEAHLVRHVRSLLKEYIDPETNIILLACAMENDLENSTAAALTENVRHRCVGLLTKADRLPVGHPTDSWRAVLNGETFQLKYGYYVTKQPNQAELDRGMNHATAREAEDQFFRTTHPWKSTFAEFQPRFGIPRLQEKLSEILVEQIRANVPRLRKTVDDRLVFIEQRLRGLPEPPGDSSFSIVSNLIAELKARLEKHMRGELPCHTFLNAWLNNICKGFRRNLLESRPTLLFRTQDEVAEKKRMISQNNGEEVIEIDVEVEPVHTPRHKRHASSDLTSPYKKPRSENASSSFTSTDRTNQSRMFIKPEPSSQPAFYDELTLAAISTTSFHIEDVRAIYEQMNTSAVVGTTDHRAEEHLILKSLDHWNHSLDTFVRMTTEHLRGLVSDLCKDLLEPWQSTLLAEELPTIINAFVTDLGAKHREHAMHLLAAEQLQPASLNDSALTANQYQESRIIREARHKWRAGLYQDKEELSKKNGRMSQGIEREEKLKKITEEQLGPDKYADQVSAMGKVRAYYNVASAGLVDSMMKLQRLDLFEHTRLYLIETVVRRLKIHEAQGFHHCQILLVEDQKRADERREFLAQRDKFQRAKAKLDTLTQQ